MPVNPELKITAEEFGEFATGLGDALMGFGVALANAGVISRQEIADQMAEVIEQQIQRDGRPRPAAQYVPAALKAIFSIPVFTGKPS